MVRFSLVVLLLVFVRVVREAERLLVVLVLRGRGRDARKKGENDVVLRLLSRFEVRRR